MRIFTACLGTETNTFAPLPTDDAAFASSCLVRGGAHPESVHMFGVPLVTWRALARERGWQTVEGLCAFATPSGPTLRRTHEALRDEILADLERAGAVDAVLLSLHGAMVAEGCDDCEGDLVRRIRERVGPGVPIGCELDLHCHVGRSLVADADALVIFKEYPHTDFEPRARELFAIVADALDGKTRPVVSAFDCRMIGVFHTTREPMRGFVDRMSALEAEPGVLSVSLGHGFPWADVPELGARVIVVTDGDAALGASLAERLGRELWSLRDAITPRFLDVDESIDRAIGAPPGPVVLADMADNPGGGAVGDSTFILRRLLERGVAGAAVGGIWDPVAVAIATGAGVGASLDLRIGGKIGPGSGDPVDLRVTVTALRAGCEVEALGGSRRHLGDVATVRAPCGDGHIEIVLHSVRGQNAHPDFFAATGVDVAAKRILVVKSMQHFHAAYAPVAADIVYVAAPGTLGWDFRALPYTRVARPVWPLDEDPWAPNVERPW